MANRKLGPVEGDICWFCKMPSDDEAWMGLGILKSTRNPVFNGHYILYHECCAVYSCGAEDTPPTGMADEMVLKFYRHGEKAAGIGLKCQLCGKRGATTGCFYGPCQQFYHFPCARARAYQGYLRFSLDGKRLACMEHAPLLPLPHEVDFMGMWMEGVGSWNGSVMEQSREQWHPAYSHYATQFLHRWGSLLNMTPAADIRAMQDMAKGSRRNIKAKGNSGKTKEDPDYRVKGGGSSSRNRKGMQQQQQPGRASSSGGDAIAPAAAAAGAPRHSSSSGGGGRRKGGKPKQAGPGGSGMPAPGQQYPQGWGAGGGVGGGVGVPADVAAAAEQGQFGPGFGGFGCAAAAAGAAGYPATSRSSMLEGAGGSGELFSPTSAFSRQHQYPAGQILQGSAWDGQHSGQHGQHQHQDYQQQWQGSADAAAAAAGVPPGGIQAGYGAAPGYARGGGGEQRSGAAAGGGGGFSSGGGDGTHALRQLLRQAGSDLQDQPGNLRGNAAAAVKPELSCQLLLAAAGFEPETHAVADWPGQRASAAGQYANQQQDWGGAAAVYATYAQRQQQQQQQRDSILAAAGPGFSAGRGFNHNPGNTAPQAAAAGDGTARLSLAPAAAAGGGGGGMPGGSSAARGGQGLGRSTSGASSADSAPNGGNHPHSHHQPGQLRSSHQQQQQWRSQAGGVTSAAAAAGPSGGVFRYSGGVLVGPGGPEEPQQPRKLLDLNVLARTGRKQLSLGLVNLDSQPPQQQQQPAAAMQAQQLEVKREVQPLQAQQPPAAAAGVSQPPLSNADMLQQIAAAMKAVTEAEGDQQTQALATAAAMIAAAAAAQAGGGAGGGLAAAQQQQQQQQQEAAGQLQDIQNEVLDLLRQQFGA